MEYVRMPAGRKSRAIEMINIVEYRLKLFVGLAGLEDMRAGHACPPVGFYSSAKACGCMVDEIEGLRITLRCYCIMDGDFVV